MDIVRMNKIKNKVSKFFLLVVSLFIISAMSHADEKKFLTVDNLIENGFIQLTGLELIELLNEHKVEVHDIETQSVSLSTRVKTEAGNTANRTSKELVAGSASYLLDTRILARAPSLSGKPDYKVSGDVLIATDGLRTYHIRFYRKQDEMYGARDIDNGSVFFKIIVK
jgi:hypothetical protein